MNPNAVPEVPEQAPVVEAVKESQRVAFLTRVEREELKALSKEVFGVSSKYQKLLETQELVTRKEKRKVEGKDGQPDTEEEVSVPVTTPGGAVTYRTKFRSREEVLEMLLKFKKQKEEFMAAMEKQREEAQAKKDAEKAAQKLQEEVGGSAL